MLKYSIIISVFNRPHEVIELLDSLAVQSVKEFEVIVVEDGSSDSCADISLSFNEQLTIHYYSKENNGQGFSRNFGAERAQGDWLFFFDSDCIIPPTYFESFEAFSSENEFDAFSGPDMASNDFSVLQRAISYSMTSFLTTGSIRGKKENVNKVEFRSFNLGIKKFVFKQLGGFAKTNMREDIELSHRVTTNGFEVVLIPDARIYHKRRNTIRSYFTQIWSVGRTRLQLKRSFGIPIRVVRLLPLIFSIGLVLCISFWMLGYKWGLIGLRIYLLYSLALFVDSMAKSENILVGALSVLTTLIQFIGYGFGFLRELISTLGK